MLEILLSAPSSGSSPRMRGTLACLLDQCLKHGIIPAHAGNTRRRTLWGRWTRDHPRACGEHRLGVYSDNQQPGIIPAHAGNTMHFQAMTIHQRDHPRACGEHLLCWALTVLDWGSSPRMRGTPNRPDLQPLPDGIIPAHAGNTGV